MPVKIQTRRSSAALWTSANPVLSAGEPGFETDTGNMKVGDGVTAWTALPYIGVGGLILPWVSGKDYKTGQPVINTGTVYTANNDHHSGATFAGDVAHWTPLPAGALATATPLANSGAGSVGTSAKPAREDHVHPSASGLLLPSGKFVPITRSNNNKQALTLNREYVLGMDLAPQRISALALCVQDAAVGGAGIVRFGLRADDGNMNPGAVAYQEALDAMTTGWKSTAAINYDHPGGLLWLTWCGQGWATTAPNLRGQVQNVSPFVRDWGFSYALGTMPLGEAPPKYATSQDGVAGALPGAFVPGGTTVCIEAFIKRA